MGEFRQSCCDWQPDEISFYLKKKMSKKSERLYTYSYYIRCVEITEAKLKQLKNQLNKRVKRNSQSGADNCSVSLLRSITTLWPLQELQNIMKPVDERWCIFVKHTYKKSLRITRRLSVSNKKQTFNSIQMFTDLPTLKWMHIVLMSSAGWNITGTLSLNTQLNFLTDTQALTI